jgi:transposase
LEENLRQAGLEIARQPLSDRQYHRESPSRGQRRKRGEQNQAIGVSRGGRSTKIHAVVDSKGRPLNFIVTGGQVHDSQKVRQQIKDEGALPVIPSRCTATKKAYCPKRIYRRRHKIENYFCRIKDWRRIATRYDKLARNYLAAAAIVGALVWIKL